METNRPDYTETLTRHGIRPTAVRLLIYKTALRFHDTFSMSELEDALESVDKSTVFRTLSLFAARHLLHEIEDGSGSTKYCICRNDLVPFGEQACRIVDGEFLAREGVPQVERALVERNDLGHVYSQTALHDDDVLAGHLPNLVFFANFHRSILS